MTRLDDRGVRLCPTPNLHARPCGLTIRDGQASVRGYQDFLLRAEPLSVVPRDEQLVAKQRLLDGLFTPHVMARRRVLDLGANGGFFSLWALQNGASEAVAVDIDPEYLGLLEQMRSAFGLSALRPAQANVSEWTEPADVVVALALVHWTYSCTAGLGLSEAIGKLAALARYLLIIEWVAPDDPAIAAFGHLDWNSQQAKEPYRFEAFEAALRRQSLRLEHLGDLSATRRLYAAFKTGHTIDLSTPLPPLFPDDRIHSSRWLCRLGGLDYWSRVYLLEDRVCKQASFELAAREGAFLARLAGRPDVPRLLSCRQERDYSVIEMEKVEGVDLRESARDVGGDRLATARFMLDCLELLEALHRHGIQHRDIRPENILVRAGRPVLIDFGWATADDSPTITPDGLGIDGRPPDRTFSDVYSMGKALECLLPGADSGLASVARLMSDPDPRLRMTDLAVLKRVVRSLMGEGSPENTVLAGLADQLAKRNEKLEWLESELVRTNTGLEELQARNLSLERLHSDAVELRGEREALAAERDALAAERDRLQAGLSELERRLDERTAERDRALRANEETEQRLRVELGDARRRACGVAAERAAIRESRVMSIARRLKGQGDLWEALPAAFDPLKRDAVRLGLRRAGSALSEVAVLSGVARVYPLDSSANGVRGVLLFAVADVPGCGGSVGVHLVSPGGAVVAIGETPLDAATGGTPVQIAFPAPVDAGGPGWQLRVFIRDSPSPVRILELQASGLLSLLGPQRLPFVALLS